MQVSREELNKLRKFIRREYKGTICKGSISIGTGCKHCEACTTEMEMMSFIRRNGAAILDDLERLESIENGTLIVQ